MKDPSFTKLELFFAQFEPLHFKKGEIIQRPGASIGGIYFLKHGFVRLYTVSVSGEELTLIIFKIGDIFPISWAFDYPTVQGYYLESLTSCELGRASRGDFLKFIKSDSEVLFELSSRLVERMMGLLARAESFVFGDAESRIASILLICAERFGKAISQGIQIEVPLTHSDIASLIGVARETASIEIKKLEKKGLIVYRGRQLVIKNVNLLKKESLS